ncbi:hypothetical protein BDV96DRAFT_574236 [Lophiotrema nucula]|uniref:NmrA-like domain-containing protein n=1 Tax=Lophiotrema nucula TaxID=690887 RepID=A0A6A5Z8L6_9PLEO|nr:hypothetical protein BDV96DRAFT_574236 [Lophiotrema nucula]
MTLEETHISVGTDNFIRKLSVERNVRTLIAAPPTILGRGLGAGRTETHQRTMYEMIIKNGAAFQAGVGANVWSTISIEDLGRACVFLIEEAQKGDESRVQFGQNGYYFIEAFELSLADRMKAIAERLYKEGRFLTPDVQSKTIKEIRSDFGEFASYLWGSSSRIRADKLRALGWKPQDKEWLRMVQEAPGCRC